MKIPQTSARPNNVKVAVIIDAMNAHNRSSGRGRLREGSYREEIDLARNTMVDALLRQ